MGRIEWIDWNEQTPPCEIPILIAMRNKNMYECGIWLYDACIYLGGDVEDEDNWNGKSNWENPVKWAYITEPENNYKSKEEK